MNVKIPLNNDWEYTETFTERLFDPGFREGLRAVRLPHTVRETPFHYFDEDALQVLCGYRRSFFVPELWRRRRVFLGFGAAGHGAEVWCNGVFVGSHGCGYTAFTLELTAALRYGQTNHIVLRLDSRESQNIPPFGFVIDYLCYGGLYRDAWLEVKEQSYLDELFARPFVPAATRIPAEALAALRFCGTLRPSLRISGPAEGLQLRYRVLERETGRELCFPEQAAEESALLRVPEARLWDVERPWLYTLTAELLDGDEVLDRLSCPFGFRRSSWRAEGYYLNDRLLPLRGLNRHQSWPYVGYAMPASQQRFDADILKRELGLNVVRTSHYPQSQAFVDRCDELGLLVFTEIPGWQHIGDAAWKAQALRNVEEMVVQYRNHPSVILWGVRINESPDDDDFYAETNAAARRLDPGRATGGVRYLRHSHLLEDVYTYNDFLHDGTNPGCLPRNKVTEARDRAYLITEHNGHMYPTKSFDDEAQRQEQALRHARVLDAALAQRGVAGCIGWCMSDYNTHRDFGSGDRICYHGVLDMFRNPKLAAALYASQQERYPVLEVGSRMDLGEHAAGLRGEVWLFTNAERVRMYRNGQFVREFSAQDSPFRHLPHGPIRIDDYIGDAMAPEGFAPRQEALVRDVLNDAALHGMGHLSAGAKAKAAAASARYEMRFSDAYRLYGRYIGNWGERVSAFRFVAVKDGQEVAERVCAPATGPQIRAEADHSELLEGDSYDVAAVRIRVCDESGAPLPFWNEPLPLRLTGPARLIGPDRACIAGGLGGTYLRTTGEAGDVRLTVALPEAYGGAETVLRFTVRREETNSVDNPVRGW